MKRLLPFVLTLGMLFSASASALSLVVPMYKFTSKHHAVLIGKIRLKDTQYGLLLIPQLKGLSPGVHGFHVHEYASCARAGMAAGGHFDPKNTKHHLGPYSNYGHMGDLPVLIVNKKGYATTPVLAPRLRLKWIIGRSLMIHAGGDNYSDYPKKLGGGGARVACGVIRPKIYAAAQHHHIQ